MRAKITAFAQEPLKQEFTPKITMPLEDWKSLQKQLSSVPNHPYPAWHLIDTIDQVIYQAESIFLK